MLYSNYSINHTIHFLEPKSPFEAIPMQIGLSQRPLPGSEHYVALQNKEKGIQWCLTLDCNKNHVHWHLNEMQSGKTKIRFMQKMLRIVPSNQMFILIISSNFIPARLW